ncbi:glyoxylase-like metal-dependent hydrolase (beta-lactamase superfamily II) [Desulfobaculum xiamenense]|uniref:Glyoxylase-like metal-dependent hydrolase (Beta-lactamase superfamily II) n=1 Tax=Desulfobaculum xiamenense TaxID=995050 RepID=A0A846QJ78_9BACT|nr:MBL fold metallo-hydrolase [Desulfobaculum xiamenense]NJB68926.1 glyoxylase-like metal-dependent hydrolase (beta-lactamase superfamily II) [Desulfobaculum xiamenense]
MLIRTFELGPLMTNGYLLSEGGRALFVDPGGEPDEVLAVLKAEGLVLERVLVTHLHFDHIYGVAALSAATGASVCASADDAYLLETEVGRGGAMGFPRVDDFAFEPLTEGETEFIGQRCNVLATPGHTRGSLTFHFPEAGAAFVGDLIFSRAVGRTDFPGGSMPTLVRSVERRIFTLPPETVLYSGHGPATTVGDEMVHNPFFQPDGPGMRY